MSWQTCAMLGAAGHWPHCGATPMGSTAYNLAAGGCVVHPEVPCVLFCPSAARTR